MIKNLTLLPLLLLIISCSKPIDDYSLVEKNGVYYQVNAEIPYNGEFLTFHNNGQKKWDRTYKDGKKDGLHTLWNENGQITCKETYKDGKRDGLHIKWYYNGQKAMECDYKDGKPDGVWTFWDYNSQSKKSEAIWKDGIIISHKSQNSDGSVEYDEKILPDEVFDDVMEQLNKKK